jgi:hypothetical protein
VLSKATTLLSYPKKQVSFSEKTVVRRTALYNTNAVKPLQICLQLLNYMYAVQEYFYNEGYIRIWWVEGKQSSFKTCP